MRVFLCVAVAGLALGYAGAGPLYAHFTSQASSGSNTISAAAVFPFEEAFDAFSGWAYNATATYPPPTGRLNEGGAFAIANGALVVDTFGTGGNWSGPIARAPLGFDVAPSQDFEMNVTLDSGATGNVEVRVSLVTSAGVHVGGLSWLSDCDDGTGAIDFHTAAAPFDATYSGCGADRASFNGTLTLRRVGTTWTGLVDGVAVATATSVPTDTASEVEVVVTLPSPPARAARVDHVEVRPL